MPQNKGKPVSHIQKDVENAIRMLLGASWFVLKQIIVTLSVISVNWNKYRKTQANEDQTELMKISLSSNIWIQIQLKEYIWEVPSESYGISGTKSSLVF